MSISQARSKLMDMAKFLSSHKEAVTITKRGEPVLAILPWDLYEGIVETLEIAGNPQLLSAVRQGIKELKTGKGIPWEKAKKQLDL